MPSRIPVVIDTDNSLGVAGSEIDDAFAIAAALLTPLLDVLAVTTVHGNAGVVEVSEATHDLLHRLGRTDVPVALGAGAPLVRPTHRGIASAEDRAEALDLLADVIRMHPGEVTIITLGPLTNIARLFAREPDLAPLVREIVGMGGAYQRTTGRCDLPGEFNMWVDPDAAAAVFASGAPIRMVGLDVTEQVRLTLADAVSLADRPGFLGHFGRQATAWIAAVAARRPADPLARESCAMHDALAVAAVVRPDLFDWQDAHVAVETASDLTRGVTVADLLLTHTPPAPNVRIASAVRTDAAHHWLMTTLDSRPTSGA